MRLPEGDCIHQYAIMATLQGPPEGKGLIKIPSMKIAFFCIYCLEIQERKWIATLF